MLIIIWYFFHNYFWPRFRPQPHSLGLGLGIEVLASFNIIAVTYVLRLNGAFYLEQKLLLTAYMDSYMRNRLISK